MWVRFLHSTQALLVSMFSMHAAVRVHSPQLEILMDLSDGMPPDVLPHAAGARRRHMHVRSDTAEASHLHKNRPTAVRSPLRLQG